MVSAPGFLLGLVLALALALLFGAHVAIAIGLARRHELGRAALTFVVPPLAPLFGIERGMRVATWIWLGAFALYAVVLAFL
jgi:hypothetical protein